MRCSRPDFRSPLYAAQDEKIQFTLRRGPKGLNGRSAGILSHTKLITGTIPFVLVRSAPGPCHMCAVWTLSKRRLDRTFQTLT